MSRRLSMVMLLLGASIVGMLADCRAQDTEAADGQIMKVMCQGRLKMGGQPSRALSTRDEGLRLKARDEVQCLGSGFVEILLPDGVRKLSGTDGKFSIPPMGPVPAFGLAITNELTRYGIPGATRGNAASSRILWPSENSAVLPENFAVQWAPVPEKISLSILSEAKDVTIWGPAEVNGDSGSWKSQAMSAALAGYKTKSANSNLILTITFSNPSDWEEVHFSLLSGRQAQELNAQLDFWAKHSDGLALRLGRAYSFTRHRLFAQAADEYDSALNSAPDSPYLLQDAIKASRLAGRPSRVKELQARMASQPNPDNP